MDLLSFVCFQAISGVMLVVRVPETWKFRPDSGQIYHLGEGKVQEISEENKQQMLNNFFEM